MVDSWQFSNCHCWQCRRSLLSPMLWWLMSLCWPHHHRHSSPSLLSLCLLLTAWSPPPIGPVARRCSRGQIRPQQQHQKHHTCWRNDDACTCQLPRSMQMLTNWLCSCLGDEWHRWCGRHCLPLPSRLTLSTPSPNSHCVVNHASTPSPDCHPLLPRQPSGRLSTSKPTIFCYLCECHIIFAKNLKGLISFLWKRLLKCPSCSGTTQKIFVISGRTSLHMPWLHFETTQSSPNNCHEGQI